MVCGGVDARIMSSGDWQALQACSVRKFVCHLEACARAYVVVLVKVCLCAAAQGTAGCWFLLRASVHIVVPKCEECLAVQCGKKTIAIVQPSHSAAWPTRPPIADYRMAYPH